MNPDIVSALVGGLTLTLAFAFFYFPWQTLVIDQTRQRLFEIRDNWFDYTLSLESEADRAAARNVRTEINYLIRLTHKVTFPVLIVAGFGHFLFGNVKDLKSPLEQLLRGFRSEEAAKRAASTVVTAFQIVTWGMVRRSIAAMLLLLPYMTLSLIIRATHFGVTSTANRLDPLIQSLGSGKGRDLALHG